MRAGANFTAIIAFLLASLMVSGSYFVVTNYNINNEDEDEEIICTENEILVDTLCIASEQPVNPTSSDCTRIEVWRDEKCQPMTPPQNLTYGATSYIWSVGDSEILTPSFIGDGPDTWSSIPEFPPFINLNLESGILTITALEPNNIMNYTIVASNSVGITTTNISITILDNPPIFSYPISNLTFILFTSSSGPTPIVDNMNIQNWTIEPNLPEGLFLNNLGVIGGTATTLGASSHIVTASNSGGSMSIQINISIIENPPLLWFWNNDVYTFYKNTEIESIIASSFDGPIVSCHSNPELPEGLFLGNNCDINGTPTTISLETIYTITATNSGGSSSLNISIIVNDQIAYDITYGGEEFLFAKNVDIINLNPNNSGGVIIEWGIEPLLPNGMFFNISTGAITGISSEETGVINYTIFGNNSGGSSTTQLTISIIDITPKGITFGNGDFVFESNNSIVEINPNNEGHEVESWKSIPPLPSGLSFSENGSIYGIPDNRTPWEIYTIFANNSGGHLQINISITIHDLDTDWLEITQGVSSVDYGGAWPSLILPFGQWAFPILVDWEGRPIASASHVGKGKIVGYGHESLVAKTNGDEMILSMNVMKWACNGVGNIGLENDFNHFEDELIAEGFTVYTSITPDQLTNLDCFVGEFWNGWSDNQNSKIIQFLNDGKGLIMGGHSWYWSYSNSDVAHNYPGNKISPTTGLFVSTHSGSSQITLEEEPPHRWHRTIPAVEALEKHFTIGPPILTSESEMIENTISRSTAMLTLDFATFWTPLRSMVNVTGWIEISDNNEYDMNSDPIQNVLLAIQEGLYLRLPANELITHPSSIDFPGSVPSSAPRIIKNISVNGDYIGLPSGFGYSGARAHGMMSTGLYAAPGEVINITVPNTIVNQNIRIQIGGHTDSLWGKDYLDRHPKVSRIWEIDTLAMEVGNTFGGLIYITFPPDSVFGMINLTIENAIEAPHYIHGITTENEWNTSIKNYPAPWAELQGEKFILTVPSSSIRNLGNPVELLEWWDTALQMQHDLSGYLPWTRVERAVFDVQISAGWMHSGYPFMAHLASVPNVVDKDHMATQGDWGMFHELGHNHQWMASTLPGNTETTCNLFSAYIMTELVGIDLGAGHSAMSDVNRQSRTETYFNAGAHISQWSVWTALETHMMIQEEFDWNIYTETFRHYYNSSIPQPTNDAEEYNYWAARISNETGMNLVPFFRAWGLPINNLTFNSVSNLPVWNTDPLRGWVYDYNPILRNIITTNITSSSADLEWETYDNGTDVNFTVCWGLFDGGTVKTAWSSCLESGRANVGFNNHPINNLISSQTYYWRVLGEGASGDIWTDVVSFNTL